MRRREFLGWLTAGVASAVTGTVMSGCAKEQPSEWEEHRERTKKGLVAERTGITREQAEDLIRTTLIDFQHYFPDGMTDHEVAKLFKK